jgi:thymidylate synthase (FAD)
MIEFGHIAVKFITDRGVAHEIVRHRLCSFAQESTRYVNYNNKGFEFIKPVWWDEWSPIERTIWKEQMCWVGDRYNSLIELGSKPQQARSILPNSLKAEIVVKANVREWRHIFKLRCNKAAHPQMVGLMTPLLEELKEKFPVLFGDL